MEPVVIIAEAGVNHNGDIHLAKELVDVAANAGADYVKFQTFKSESLVAVDARKAEYQVKNMGDDIDNSQYQMLKKLELDVDAHRVLIDYCTLKNINFLSTAFDLESIDLLNDLGIPFFKVPSGDITNLPYLRKIALLNKPVVISTGMSNLDEVRAALDVFLNNGLSKDKITILHCTTEYPTPLGDVNLNAMLTLKNELGVKVGYSDHTLGIEVAIAAVALGATVIEKHFTLDKKMKGPDHKASLEPHELFNLVTGIRNIETAMGTGRKLPTDAESKNISFVRKSIHLKRDVKKGETLDESQLIMKRPGNGISPMSLHEVLNKTFTKDLLADCQLKWEDIE